ncbi:MAG: Aminopeptidase family protein [Chloroflexi bacterium]|nr:Aminopeptidase family protein [Chloroflexota bacterium]
MAAEGVDGFFGLRWEHMRYLTGLPFDEGEVTGSGDSGKFLITGRESIVLADSRYTIAVGRDAPGSRAYPAVGPLAGLWPDLLADAGVTRVAVEAMTIPHLAWERLQAAAPGVELVPVDGWVEAIRQVKEPSEVERIAAACAVADRALALLLPSIRPGVTERELALDLEWRIRTGGAERLAFDVACLAGPEAALPHGSPGDRPVRSGAVLLFDFGAQVAGYRSDMTRTIFVGEPSVRDLAVHEVVLAAQSAAIDALRDALAGARHGALLPSGPEIDQVARAVIEADGRWPAYGHGLGHGIGIATHELPGLGSRSPTSPLPTPTVFSVEPGIYLEGETGVRIEDLVHLDAAAGALERLTRFPSGVVVVGA